MNISDKGLALIKEFEGWRDAVYNDIAGFRTIGYGHRLAPAEEYPNGIDLVIGERLLEKDVAIAENGVNRFVSAVLTQGQFDALVDFVFNLGSSRLRNSTLLQLLNAGRYEEAGWQLLKWDHAGGVEVEDLKSRREAEHALWCS